MPFFLKARSEDYILRKISDEVAKQIDLVKNLYEKQCLKSDVNKNIVDGIKDRGQKFDLTAPKAKLLAIIFEQKELLKQLSLATSRVERSLNLLVHMEQISLALHHRNDDLSDMIDVKAMPLERFKTEIEHVKMLMSSFEILRVELEKQTEYVEGFDPDEKDPEEQYFEASERYESTLAEQEVISISQLKDFCTDLKQMVRQRLHAPVVEGSEADKAAEKIVEEFKRIKIGFFFSMNRMVNRLVKDNVQVGHQRKLVTFLIFFLLSRLKKYNAGAYYAQLRACIMAYKLSHGSSSVRNACAGAALLGKLRELDFPLDKLLDDEKEITRTYYLTVNQIFEEEFTFVNSVIAAFHGGESAPVPWIGTAAKIMALVYEFDSRIENEGFVPEKIRAARDSIRDELQKAHPGMQREIMHLLGHWEKWLPASIRPQNIYSSEAKNEQTKTEVTK